MLTSIALHTQSHIWFVLPKDIMYCKSDDCYLTVYLSSDEKIMISKTLAKFSKELNAEIFIRISQFILINKNFIRKIHKKNKQVEMVNNEKIPFTTTLHKLLELIGS